MNKVFKVVAVLKFWPNINFGIIIIIFLAPDDDGSHQHCHDEKIGVVFNLKIIAVFDIVNNFITVALQNYQ